MSLPDEAISDLDLISDSVTQQNLNLSSSSEISGIPPIWFTSEIGDLAQVVAGGTPKSNDSSNFTMPGEGVSWLTPADLSRYNHQYISFGARDLSKKGYELSSAKLMPKDSILFSSRAPIGYVVIAANEISTNQGFKSFVFTKEIHPKFAYFYLKSIRDLAESRGSGTTFKELSGAAAKKLPFIVAPLAEQQQIAAKLDELLAQVDNLKIRLDNISKILKRFRQSVLSAAVSGKLTEDWRLENLISESDWHKIKVGDLVKFIEAGKNLMCIETPPVGDQHGIIKISAVTWGIYDENESKTLPDQKLFVESRRIKSGDFLISRANTLELIGMPVIVKDVSKNLMLSDKVWRLVMNEADKMWLSIFLRSNFGRKEIESRSTGNQLSMRNIGQKTFLDINLPKPSKKEQTEIVTRVEQLFSYADQIEQSVKDAQSRVNHLTQAILAKAFRGELTADWRAQNPDLISGENSAASLLERIKLERSIGSNEGHKSKQIKIKSSVVMKQKQIIPIFDALKVAGQPLSSQDLLIQSGYPSDASTKQLEAFFLDIREQLNAKVIIRNRQGEIEFFAIAE